MCCIGQQARRSELSACLLLNVFARPAPGPPNPPRPAGSAGAVLTRAAPLRARQGAGLAGRARGARA